MWHSVDVAREGEAVSGDGANVCVDLPLSLSSCAQAVSVGGLGSIVRVLSDRKTV